MLRLASFVTLAVLMPAALARAQEVPAENPTDPAKIEFFEKKIRPLLVEKCYSCHSDEAKKLKGKFRLDSREGLLKGGEEFPGKTIDMKKPEQSQILRMIDRTDEDYPMPPKEKDALSEEQVKDFKAWVLMGLPYGEDKKSAASTQPAKSASAADPRAHWSFQPVKAQQAPQPPASAEALGWAKTDIDRFVVAKLNEERLAPSKVADKRTLIRRATFDLIGLPPTPEEIAAFEADASADAFEKVIDRLLASPHYGERWGRHWLDVARYADSKGYVFEEERRFPFSYTYRDWVIRAFNSDLPYDQFLVHQIAADRLDLKGDDTQHLAALGFLTLGRRFLNNPHDIIDDRIDVVTRGTMGLTVSCARCHDHIYDPIPTADYYSLYGVFASSREPAELPLISAPDQKDGEAFEKELSAREAEIDGFKKTHFDGATASIRSEGGLSAHLQSAIALRRLGDEESKDERRAIIDKFSVSRFVVQRWVAKLTAAKNAHDPVFAPLLAWSDTQGLSLKSASQVLAEQMVSGRLLAKPLNPQVAAQVVLTPTTSLKELAECYAALLVQFDKPEALADADEEALRQVLRGENAPANVTIADVDKLLDRAQKSALNALVQKRDALVASHPGSPPRAMALEDGPIVEPVIFKRGNAASRGDPVPRQFLAILSKEKPQPFTSGSGRLELARAIASRENPLTARVMVNRVWLHHFGQGLVRTPSDFGTRGEPPTHPELLDYLARTFMDDGWSIKKLHRRIMTSAVYQQASEQVDAAYALDPENRLLWRQNRKRLDFESLRDSLLFAAGQLDQTIGGRPVDINGAAATRRTVYGFIDRQNLPGMFRTFDFASPDATVGQRFNTSVPQQALFMMNSPLVLRQAQQIVKRTEVAAAPAAQRVELLYKTVLGRPPAPEEAELALKFVALEQAQAKPDPVAAETYWRYGYGNYDEATAQVNDFKPLSHFAENMYRGGAQFPDATLGWAMLNANGGHAGDGFVVVRRWTAPNDGTVRISGTLEHGAAQGDGVHGRVVVRGEGELASYTVHKKQADTDLSGIAIKKGDTIDFIIDRRASIDHDAFGWPVLVKLTGLQSAAGGEAAVTDFNAVTQFAAPPGNPPEGLGPWEKYAQALLQTNEFAFVD
ncbi:MAG TPA: PSD1 and planctomycete cytochrome C domain-containing protein [Tepidisphaeraceae bacterium]|nr:PSD1 and planctomycete cytochrome C domain-containing protein [Tepidisphaeraceae bacterium]